MISKTTTQSSVSTLRRCSLLWQMPLLGALASSIALAGSIHDSGEGDVVIDTTGVPAIVTSEEKDHGVWAQSTGGGNIGITNGSEITTAGNNAHGIYGNTTDGGSIYIKNTESIQTSGNFATGITASGTGLIEIDNQADIHTQGTSAHGIAVYPGAGEVTIRNTGNLFLEGNVWAWAQPIVGILVDSSSSGAVNIFHDGDMNLTGHGAGGNPMGVFGIFTHTRSSADSTITASGNITVTGNAPADAPVSPYQIGIENRAEYGNATVNYSGGTLTAAGTTGTRGLVAWSSNTSTGTKAEVNVGLDGRMTEVNAHGSDSFGVLASSGENTVRVGSNASVLGATGVQLQGVSNLLVNDGHIKASGSGKTGATIYSYRGNGTATLINTGTIEGDYGVRFTNASGTVVESGSLYNSGVIRSNNGEDGIAVYLNASNIDVTLDTGSDITGSIYSNGSGNTVTLHGTGQENSAFVASGDGSKFALTVENNGSTASNWTLNGNRAQLDGIGSITIRNTASEGRASASASRLTLHVPEAGDYTFDHALDGNGRLRIGLMNTIDRIGFSENTGTNFAGVVELGTGTFLMGGASGSEGYWNASALSNAQSGLLIDHGNHFIVTGQQGIGSGGLTLNDGALFELVFDGENAMASSFLMDGGLLSIASGASLQLSGAEDFAATESMVFNIITGANALNVEQGAFSEGTAYAIGGIDFYIHHAGGDIFLSATPVPEPATFALLASGLALAVVAFRRRKR